MYAIQRIEEGLWQITLPNPSITALPAARPLNVYLFTGASPALINVGHPAQQRALAAALRELGIEPSRIERVVATSWSIDVLGGITGLPQADLFLLSPDMIQPTRHDDWQQGWREEWEAMLATLREHPHFANLSTASAQDASEVSAADAEFFDAFFPKLSNQLEFIPLRAGHTIQLGDHHALEVIAAPGPDPGHLCLYSSTKSWLFCGELPRDGMPERMTSVRDMLASLERCVALEPKLLLPNRGMIREWGGFTLQRGARFLNNFLSNATSVMKEAPTLLEFVESDMGYLPNYPIRYASTLLIYQALLDEMVRARLVLAEGKGWSRRYGVEPPEDDDAQASEGSLP